MLGCDAMVKCLEAEGVRAVFGYPGVAIAPFYNSMLQTDEIESVLVRTEQNAGHAANGYSRVTGAVGVCAVTSGPGATNLITGIATAYADSIPMVCITGQVESTLLGSDVFQEADITGAVESFVKYSYLVKDVKDIPRVFKEAFHIANTGRRGPVLIDVPIDIQNAKLDKFSYPEEVVLRTYKPTVKGNVVQIKKLLKELSKAKKPLICAGGGVILSGAQTELADFAAKYRVPVVHTMMGIGVLPSDHEMYYGMVGNNGKGYANAAMNDADLLVIIGARVADRAVNQPDLITENKVMVHIDVDPAEIGKNAASTIPIVGDVKTILMQIEEEAKDVIVPPHKQWLETLDEYKVKLVKKRHPDQRYVDPAVFIDKLSRAMKDDGIYIADVGQNQIWSCANYVMKKGRFLTSGGMGTMGYSIPAGMGAKRALGDDAQVVAVCGDGAFQMSFMEFATMKQHAINIKVIVLKNNYLGMVRQYQHFKYNDNYSVVDLTGSPDLEKIALACDIPFVRVQNMENIDKVIADFLADDSLALMECIIDPMDLV